MKFTAGSITVALSVAGSSLALATPRALPTNVDCISAGKYVGIHRPDFSYSPACAKLSFDCQSKVQDTAYIWSKTSCVAAATCESPSSIVTLARCNGTEPKTNPTVTDQELTPAMSTNIYKNIVGSCADQGCPMTQQNYIDFVYGALTAINSTDYPDVNVVINTWWGSLKNWTATGETIPYSNFNDFLHYDKV